MFDKFDEILDWVGAALTALVIGALLYAVGFMP